MSYREIQKPVEDKNTAKPSRKERWIKLKCKMFGHETVYITCFHNDTVKCVTCGEEHHPPTEMVDIQVVSFEMAWMRAHEEKGIKQGTCPSPCCPKKVGF